MGRSRVVKGRRKVPRYIRKLEYLQKTGVLPCTGVQHLHVLHDDWCRHWTTPGECNCDPIIRLALPADRRN
jgi:hypothetical protein